jgi:hypothetical protein
MQRRTGKKRREWEMGFGEARWLLGLLLFFFSFFS